MSIEKSFSQSGSEEIIHKPTFSPHDIKKREAMESFLKNTDVGDLTKEEREKIKKFVSEKEKIESSEGTLTPDEIFENRSILNRHIYDWSMGSDIVFGASDLEFGEDNLCDAEKIKALAQRRRKEALSALKLLEI